MGKEATAYFLDDVTIPVISEKTGIEEEVLRDWLGFDLTRSLQTKVIVVEITQD